MKKIFFLLVTLYSISIAGMPSKNPLREYEQQMETKYRRFVLGSESVKRAPTLEEISLIVIAQHGIIKKSMLGIATGKLYIKNLALIAKESQHISPGLMACFLGHLSLQKDSHLALKKQENGKIVPLSKDEIERALSFLHTEPGYTGVSAMRDFLTGQSKLYDLVALPPYRNSDNLRYMALL